MNLFKFSFYTITAFILGTTLTFAHLINAELKDSFKEYPAKTELSKKALQLRRGMTPQQVLELLGTPTWAEHYKGLPLGWSWRNGNCNPVDVTFGKNMRVDGFDEGRSECLDSTYVRVPAKRYLCSNADNKSLCSNHSS